MIRALSHMLVALALLMQIGVGALPAGTACICLPAPEVKACCAHKAAVHVKAACRLCGCQRGPESCICVPTVENHAVPTIGPRTVDVPVEIVAAPILTARPVPVMAARSRVPAAPGAHESPPGLPRAVSLPLLL